MNSDELRSGINNLMMDSGGKLCSYEELHHICADIVNKYNDTTVLAIVQEELSELQRQIASYIKTPFNSEYMGTWDDADRELSLAEAVADANIGVEFMKSKLKISDNLIKAISLVKLKRFMKKECEIKNIESGSYDYVIDGLDEKK